MVYQNMKDWELSSCMFMN